MSQECPEPTGTGEVRVQEPKELYSHRAHLDPRSVVRAALVIFLGRKSTRRTGPGAPLAKPMFASGRRYKSECTRSVALACRRMSVRVV